MEMIWWRGSLTVPAPPASATAPSSIPPPCNASTPAASDGWKPVAKLATNREIPPGVAMADSSRAADARTECDGRIDAPTLSEGGVEMVVPESYRFPHEANRALVQVILAVRDRMLGSGRGVA